MKTFARAAALLGATFLATPILAEAPIFVDDPAACDITGPTRDERVFNITDTGVMVLEEAGMYAIEYGCEFAPAVPLDAPLGDVQTRVGYCSEPGFIDPGVFTFAAHEPGRITVYSSLWDTPSTFAPCE